MLPPDLEQELIPWYKFWQPPLKFKIPSPPPGQIYVPLVEKAFSAYFKQNINEFPGLAESLNANSFVMTVNNATIALKTPFFKLAFIRWFIVFLMFFWFIYFIVSCANGNVAGVIIYLILIIMGPFLMRLGCTQHLVRMQKYEKVLKKCCGSISNTILAGSGYHVEPGTRCLWLIFHTGSYAPPQPAPYMNPNPVQYFYPGSQVGYNN